MKPQGKIIKRAVFDPTFQPLDISPVIKHRVVSAFEEAKGIVQKANRNAQKIRQQASQVLKDAQVQRERECQRGYEEGPEQGLGELTQKIMDAGRAEEKVLNEAEPQIIRMVMDISEKVIGREIEKGAIVDVVKKTITQAVGKKIVVRLNPADMVLVKGREKDLLTVLEQNQSVNVREDEAIPAGGCIVESEMGAVDARLDTQLAAIKKALGLEG